MDGQALKLLQPVLSTGAAPEGRKAEGGNARAKRFTTYQLTCPSLPHLQPLEYHLWCVIVPDFQMLSTLGWRTERRHHNLRPGHSTKGSSAIHRHTDSSSSSNQKPYA